jgi:hypothetical protein
MAASPSQATWQLEALIRQLGAALLTFDNWQDFASRRALAQLRAMAKRTGVAVVLVSLLSKAALPRAERQPDGTVQVTACKAMGADWLILDSDPDDESSSLLVNMHTGQGLPFRLKSASNMPTAITEWGAA